jgi:hypothetical protein
MSEIINKNIFGEDLLKKFQLLEHYKDKIYQKHYENIYKRQKFQLSYFEPLQNIHKESLEKLNNVFKIFGAATIYLLCGLVYCILHTRKLYRMQILKYKKSGMLVWGYYLIGALILIQFESKRMLNNIDINLNELLIRSVFHDEIEKINDKNLQEKQVNLLINKYEFLRKNKLI